jgi:hypothetical protein
MCKSFVKVSDLTLRFGVNVRNNRSPQRSTPALHPKLALSKHAHDNESAAINHVEPRGWNGGAIEVASGSRPKSRRRK